jgi:hypothetical protein
MSVGNKPFEEDRKLQLKNEIESEQFKVYRVQGGEYRTPNIEC